MLSSLLKLGHVFQGEGMSRLLYVSCYVLEPKKTFSVRRFEHVINCLVILFVYLTPEIQTGQTPTKYI